MTEPRKRNEWFTPPHLLAVLGMAGMVMTSYTGFREDSVVKMAVMNEKIIALQGAPLCRLERQ